MNRVLVTGAVILIAASVLALGLFQRGLAYTRGTHGSEQRYILEAVEALIAGETGPREDAWQAQVTNDGDSQNGDECEIKAGTSGKKIAVLFLKVSCDTSMTVTIEDEDNNALDVTYIAARGGYVARFPPEAPLLVNDTAANKALRVQGSTAGYITVTATGYLYD